MVGDHMLRTSSPGQAVTEIAIALTMIAVVFFGVEYLCSLLRARNQARQWTHALLFKFYRDSEGVSTGDIPPVDPTHLMMQVLDNDFHGRRFLTVKPDHIALAFQFTPHLGQEVQAPFVQEAFLYRDPWFDHPLKYALWAAAAAKSALSTYTRASGGGEAGGAESSSPFDLGSLGGMAELLQENTPLGLVDYDKLWEFLQ